MSSRRPVRDRPARRAPNASRKALRTTNAPSLRRARAMPRPMPRAAPVTRATLLCRQPIFAPITCPGRNFRDYGEDHHANALQNPGGRVLQLHHGRWLSVGRRGHQGSAPHGPTDPRRVVGGMPAAPGDFGYPGDHLKAGVAPLDPRLRTFVKSHHCDERAEVLADVLPLREMTTAQRAAELRALCTASAHMLAASPYAERARALTEPPHPSYFALLARCRADLERS